MHCFIKQLWNELTTDHPTRRPSLRYLHFICLINFEKKNEGIKNNILRFPNHWWANSWATTLATSFLFAVEASLGLYRKDVSRNDTRPLWEWINYLFLFTNYQYYLPVFHSARHKIGDSDEIYRHRFIVIIYINEGTNNITSPCLGNAYSISKYFS